MSGGVGW